MRHALSTELSIIYSHFQARRDFFGHVRKDALGEQINAGQCIYQEGVVVTYQRYKRAGKVAQASNVRAKAGDVILHQILNSNQFNGAAGRVFDQFVEQIAKGTTLYLSVRRNNKVARAFYERHGMKIAGKASWADGTILGLIYLLRA